MTAGRPEGEKCVIKVINAKTKVAIELTEANLIYSTGTDNKGNELTTLTITGLKANTKYTVEVQAYTGESLDTATQKTAQGKVSISTAKYAAVSRVNAALSGDSVTLNWQIPDAKKTGVGSVYTAYEIDWLISRNERKSVAIESVAAAIQPLVADSNRATVLLETLKNLGIDMTSTKKQNFVIRAVIYAEDGSTVIHQSLDAKFSITPAKLV